MRPGDRVAGRYEIIDEAGRGGMGTVYRALDRKTREQVAVKTLASVEGAGGTRFAREVAALQALAHPAIVRYLAHGADYLVTEWLEGETLADRLAGRGLDGAGALRACARVAEALAEAHRHGIVHRDIKPSNIMLVGGDPGRATVVDFGIARTPQAERLTRTGVIVGTFGYLSPEQAQGAAAIDGRADLFALGCVLYECLTGVRPFAGESVLAARAKVLLADAPSLAQMLPGAPRALDELAAALLAKDPARRPAGADVVARTLAAIDPGALPAAPPPSAAGQRDTEAARIPMAAVLLPSSTAETFPDARVHPLADGRTLLVVRGPYSAAEHTARAARLALAVRERRPAGPIYLTSASIGGGAALADALGRTVAEVEILLPPGAPEGGEPVIWIDDGSRALLGDAFEVRPRAGGHELVGESG